DQVDARHAVNHAMVYTRNHCGAFTFKTINKMDVPKRPAAIHHWSQNATGQLYELALFSGLVDPNLKYVPADIEVLIEFPGRMGNPKRIGRYNLLIARQQVHLRIDHCDEIVKRDF